MRLVSAWATRQRLVPAQEAVGGKSNEITAIPPPLGRPALAGALVTIDAIGTRDAIATAIPRRAATDPGLGPAEPGLPVLKANRPATFEDVGTSFADPPPGGRRDLHHHRW